jgi:hypothetical protein
MRSEPQWHCAVRSNFPSMFKPVYTIGFAILFGAVNVRNKDRSSDGSRTAAISHIVACVWRPAINIPHRCRHRAACRNSHEAKDQNSSPESGSEFQPLSPGRVVLPCHATATSPCRPFLKCAISPAMNDNQEHLAFNHQIGMALSQWQHVEYRREGPAEPDGRGFEGSRRHLGRVSTVVTRPTNN